MRARKLGRWVGRLAAVVAFGVATMAGGAIAAATGDAPVNSDVSESTEPDSWEWD